MLQTILNIYTINTEVDQIIPLIVFFTLNSFDIIIIIQIYTLY